MRNSIVNDLREQEGVILSKRECHKKQIRILTKDLYNTRQKIKYAQKNENKGQGGALFKMFGKKRSELTPEELRQYNNSLRKIRQEKK